MRAGRVLVRSHGKVHVDKILPSLEAGLTDEDYRIRVASLTLLGDLLGMIGGTTVVKGDGETQDDIRRAERAQAQIALVLGAETRKRVLSGLYMARSDTAAVVRQSAIQVWKTIVSVTARTLRDILQVLVGQIIDALASGDPERTQVAGRCLGDVVHKLGDSVLPQIIPVLRNALYTGDENTRTGVCVGLSEVLGVSTREQILRFIEIIVKVVQDALCDEDEGVRDMAASCFQNLHKAVGNKALDEIVPSLLVALESDDETKRIRALNGLTGILSIRSRELLPYIIPRLIQTPITETHANALSSIAAVTGATIHMHFSSIVPNLITELGSFYGRELDEDEKRRMEAIQRCVRSVCHNVDEGGVNWLVSEIASKCGSDKEEIRIASCWIFQAFVEESKLPLLACTEPVLKLTCRLNDDTAQFLYWDSP
jgi:HEAT repeat protein